MAVQLAPSTRRAHTPVGGDGTGPELGHRPALDGLRAVALLAVLAFHQGVAEARGGFLGVSSFFTLSGFLIATLALAEQRRTGRLSLARFWERRARRLLPAALVTLAGIVVLQSTVGIGAGPGFGSDVLAGLGYVTNWRLAAEGGDYADLFASPSPLTHLWSLAIEEQFYLLFPLVFLAVTALVRRRPARTGAVFAAAALASFATAAVVAGREGNGGLAYYGTHTRAGELLVGVVLACAFAEPAVRRAVASGPAGAVVRAGALPALAGLAALWTTTTLGAERLFSGVTLVNALLTAWVVLAAAGTDGGPVGLLLGNRPLRAVGTVSYGAYLFHWPLYLLVDEPRVHLEVHVLFAVRVGVTLAAATVSYWAVEHPFRHRLAMPRPRLALTFGAGALVVALAVLTLPRQPSAQIELDLSSRGGDADDLQFGVRNADAVVPHPGAAHVTTVLAAGDSVSWSMLAGLAVWNDHHPEAQLRVDAHMSFGCPLTGPGPWRGPDGVTPTWPDCDSWLADLPGALRRSDPDVVFIVMGLADLGGRQVDGEWRDWGDPTFERWADERIDRVADVLDDAGVPVVWATFPTVRLHDPGDPTADPARLPINDPARVDALNAAIRRATAGRPDFRVVDMDAWIRAWPEGPFDRRLRDGVHFSFVGSERAGLWLGPSLVGAAPG